MKNEQCPWPRGRGLGGTTLINYMIYTRGHKKDYDRWAAQGNPGWSYEQVLPYFLKSENSNLRFVDEGYHSEGGPLNVEDIRWKSKVVDAFITGAKEMGKLNFTQNLFVSNGPKYRSGTASYAKGPGFDPRLEYECLCSSSSHLHQHK